MNSVTIGAMSTPECLGMHSTPEARFGCGTSYKERLWNFVDHIVTNSL